MPPPRRWNIDPAGAPGRYPVLDALRAVAIMLVLLRHWSVAAHAAFGAPAGGPLAMLCANGWLGVDLFFVLSGFLIVNHFVGAGAGAMRIDRHAILEFYRRRAFRTLPLYWAVIALCWIAGGYGAGPVFSVGTFSTYLLFLQDYLGSDLLVTLWSLAVEEKFYLIAPALAALLMLAGRRVGGATLIALMAWVFWSMLAATRAVAPGDYPQFFWTVLAPFHHAVFAILAGALVALLHGAPAGQGAARPAWRFYCCAAALLCLHSSSDWLARGDWRLTCWAIAASSGLFALLVGSGLAVNRDRPAFGAARSLRRIAKLSYALYLVHFSLLGPAITASHALLPQRMLAQPALASAAFLILYLSMSWLCAWLLHVAVERPFLRLRDRRRAAALAPA